MIDLNRPTPQHEDETPTGVIILTLLPFVLVFWAILGAI